MSSPDGIKTALRIIAILAKYSRLKSAEGSMNISTNIYININNYPCVQAFRRKPSFQLQGKASTKQRDRPKMYLSYYKRNSNWPNGSSICRQKFVSPSLNIFCLQIPLPSVQYRHWKTKIFPLSDLSVADLEICQGYFNHSYWTAVHIQPQSQYCIKQFQSVMQKIKVFQTQGSFTELKPNYPWIHHSLSLEC